MTMRISFALMLAAALFLNATQAMAGHLPGERHIFRTVGALAGVFGGAAIGVTIGDTGSTNYTRNVTAGLLVGGIGGGVGGFFLGRMIDKGRARSHQADPQKSNPGKPDQQKISEIQARAMEQVTKELAARLRQPALQPVAGR